MTIVNSAELAKIVTTSPGRKAYVKLIKYMDHIGTETKLHDTMMMVSAYNNYGNNQHYFRTTFPDGVVSSHYFHNDCQIEILSEDSEEVRNLKAKFELLAANNLERNLGHYCSSVISAEIFAVKPSGNVFPCWQQYKEKNDRFAHDNFTTSSNTCLAWTMDSLQGYLKNAYYVAKAAKPGSTLTISSVKELGKKTLREANEKNLTIYPDDVKNAYGLKYSLPPAREVVLRGASAKPTWISSSISEENAPTLVKTMDAIIGVMCVSLLHELDEPVLRTIHALPGEYRVVNGGLEYGGLSNGWICHPFIANLVFDLSRKALALVQNGYQQLWKATEDEVVNTMLTCDVTKAREILERNKIVLMKMITAAWGYDPASASALKVYEIIMNGVSVAVKDPNDLVNNWNLEGTWCTHCDGTNKNVRLAIASLIKDPNFRIA
jgi:hypothetical protein